MESQCRLSRRCFAESETEFCHHGELKVTTFRYASGVEAVRILNEHGHIEMLPFQGQQIWDAVFYGRSLKMQNYFDSPVLTRDLLDSYGAFLFHCGALRMGTPGPEDDHPLHGELPAAPYSETALILGIDDAGPYVGLTGAYNYTRAFGSKYTARPMVKLHEDSTVIDVSMTIENEAAMPMDLMYMCHANFFPAPGGEIVQGASWTPADMEIRSSIPSHVHPTPQFLEFLQDLKSNPERTRILRREDSYNPEIVFFLKNLRTDASGDTHMLQKHEDGTSDYISYSTSEFPHTVRWILQHDDQKVNGMALPSTCGPEGYHRELDKGNVQQIAGKSNRTFKVRVGALNPTDTSSMIKRIRSL